MGSGNGEITVKWVHILVAVILFSISVITNAALAGANQGYARLDSKINHKFDECMEETDETADLASTNSDKIHILETELGKVNTKIDFLVDGFGEIKEYIENGGGKR